MIKDLLKKIGLSDKEADIYLSLLEIGSAPASVLAKRAGIRKSTTHYICQELVKKRLFNVIQKKNTLIFSVENPERLRQIVEEKQKKFQVIHEDLERMMEKLKAIQNPRSMLPKIKFYEGKEGMIQLYDSILELHAPIDSFEDKGEMKQFIPDYFPQFIKYRVNHKIWNRVICPSVNPINTDTPKEFRKTRTLDVHKFPFDCDIKICLDQISIFSFSKDQPVGIAIKNQNIANNFRMLFNSFWNFLGSK